MTTPNIEPIIIMKTNEMQTFMPRIFSTATNDGLSDDLVQSVHEACKTFVAASIRHTKLHKKKGK